MTYARNEKNQMIMQQKWQWQDLAVVDGAAEFAVTDGMFDAYFELTFRLGDEILITTIPYEG